MNLAFKKMLITSTLLSSLAHAQPATCIEQCNAAFGELLGQSFATKAFSNCSGNCVSDEKNELSLGKIDKPIFTGMKWQCVEYARRWLIENRGVTFGEVEYAYNIWNLPFAETIDTHKKIPVLTFKNKQSKEAPKVGDLLINSVQLAITGHVSVVVGVEHDSIIIAEQNYFNRPWETSTYSRRLLLDKDVQGFYRVFDESLIGWVRMENKG